MGGLIPDVAVDIGLAAADFSHGGGVDGQVAGQGSLLLGQKGMGLVVVVAIVASGVAVAGAAEGHADVIVPGLGAHNPDIYKAVVNLRHQLYGVIGGVADFQIRALPVHRGIQSHRHIGGGVAVADPLHRFQLGIQRGQIQGGGHLADAAPQGVNQPGAGVGRGLLIAGFLGALAQGGVVGQGLSGLEHHAVQGRTGQLQVGVALFVGAVGGLAEAQGILEIHLLPHHRRGNGFQGHPDGFAGVCCLQKPVQLLFVTAQAIGAGDGGFGNRVNFGIHRLQGDFFQDCTGICLRGGLGRQGRGQIHGIPALGQRLPHQLRRPIHVHGVAGNPQGHRQSGQGSAAVHAVLPQIRNGPFQCIGGILTGLGQLPGDFFQPGAEGGIVQPQIGCQGQLPHLRLSPAQGQGIAEQGAAVQAKPGILPVQGDFPAGKAENQGMGGRVKGTLHRQSGLLPAHAPQGKAGNRNPRGYGLGASPEEEKGPRRQQHQGCQQRDKHPGFPGGIFSGIGKFALCHGDRLLLAAAGHQSRFSSSARALNSDSRGFFRVAFFCSMATPLAAWSMLSRVPAPATQPPGQAIPSSR